MRNQQAEMIKHMTDRQVLTNLYLTQLLILVVSFVIGWIFLPDFELISNMFRLEWGIIALYGGGSALIVLLIDFSLMKVLPNKMYDDGGINEKVFERRPIWHIFIICLVVSFSEELLFRGVLQTLLGYVIASSLFAVMHIRYLSKFILFFVVVALSFFLGWIFEVTNNLYVTFFSHFLIDFVLALFIRFKYLKGDHREENI